MRIVDEEGKQVRRTYEVDFVAGKESQRYYIQSAWRMPDEEKEEQESEQFGPIVATDVLQLSRIICIFATMDTLRYYQVSESPV